MGEDIQAGNIEVAFRADLSKFTGGLDQVTEQLKGFKEQAGNQLKEFTKFVAEAFSLREISRFAMESVRAYAAEERGLNTLNNVLKATDKNYASLGNQVHEYIKQTQMATRFQDSELLDSMKTLTTATGDWRTAMALNERAMNLSVLTGKPLAETTQLLSLAYIGNERGIMSLGRALKINTEHMTNAQPLIDALDKKFGNLARSENDAAGDLDHFAKNLENFKKEVGAGLASFIRPIEVFVMGILDMGVQTEVFIMNVGMTIFRLYQQLVWQTQNTVAFLTHVWRHPIDATIQFAKATAKGISQTYTDIKNDWVAFAQTTSDIYSNLSDKVEKRAELGKLKAKDRAKEEIVAVKTFAEMIAEELKQQDKSIFSAIEMAHRKYQIVVRSSFAAGVEGFNAYKTALHKQQEDMDKAAKHIAETMKEFGSNMATTISADFKTFTDSVRAGNASLVDSFAVLGKAILKSVVGAIGQTLIQRGAQDITEAIAALLIPFPLPGIASVEDAPGLFAAGALLSAAGGTTMGIAGGMAKGGVMMDPSLVTFAEKEPELAVPLSQVSQTPFGPALANAAGLGGGIHVERIQIINQGVRDMASFSGAGVRRSMARTLAEAQDNSNYRQGKRRKK